LLYVELKIDKIFILEFVNYVCPSLFIVIYFVFDLLYVIKYCS